MLPATSDAPCRPLSSPSPPASTPISSTSVVVQERREGPDRVRAPAHARDHARRERSLRHDRLLARLVADHALEVADERRVRSRPDDRADDVVRRRDVRDPVANRRADGLLERSRPDLDRRHLRAEQPHPLDVRPLAAHVLGPHVDDALEVEQRAGGRGRHAVLAGAGLGDHARLAHPPREQRLADRVVDLVRAGVREVLALQVDAPAGRLGQPLGEEQRRGAADVVAQQRVELGPEAGVGRAPRPTPPSAPRSPATSVSGT